VWRRLRSAAQGLRSAAAALGVRGMAGPAKKLQEKHTEKQFPRTQDG
jgi:hypothetical protein